MLLSDRVSYLLGLTTRPRPSAADRRTATRYPAAESCCRLGWWEGPEFRESASLLLDISLRGALVFCDVAHAVGLGLWFRLEGESESPWLEARVMNALPTALGPCRLGLVFRRSCPYDTFKAAAFGPGILANPAEWALGEYEDPESRDWW